MARADNKNKKTIVVTVDSLGTHITVNELKLIWFIDSKKNGFEKELKELLQKYRIG